MTMTKIGEYTVSGEFGRGAYGIVYRAFDQTGHLVAVKILSVLPRGERIGSHLRMFSLTISI